MCSQSGLHVVTDEHILFSLFNCRWEDEIKFVNIKYKVHDLEES